MVRTGAIGAGIVLIGTHLLTSLLQYDPLAAQFFLERHLFRPSPQDGLFVACIFGFLALWLFQAFGSFSARATCTRACDALSGVLGHPGTVLFFATFFVPMRQMETNSGYVNISPESILAWLLLLLDLVRSLASLRLTIAFLASWTPSLNTDPARSSSPPLSSGLFPNPSSTSSTPSFVPTIGTIIPRKFFFSALLIGLAIAIATQFGPLENVPHVQDEIIQDWQARTLSAGLIHGAPIPERISFQTDRLDDNGSWLHSSYQPGLSLIWSLFASINGIGLVNPLLALFCLLLWRDLVTKATDRTTGILAASLLAVSPFFWLMAAGRMNHLLALFLLLSVARGLMAAYEGRLPRGALLAGLSCGVFLMTRRVDAAVTIAALLITFLSLSSRPLGHRFVFVLLSCLLTGLVFYIQTAFSHACSGDALSMVRWGQIVARSWWDIPAGALFANFFDALSGFSFYAFGGVITGLAGFLFLHPRTRVLDRFFVIQSVATVVAYGLYDFQDYCYGPRFWFNLLPAVTLGLANGLQLLSACGYSTNVPLLIPSGTMIPSAPFSHASSPALAPVSGSNPMPSLPHKHSPDVPLATPTPFRWSLLRSWFFCATGFALLTLVHQAQAVFNREFWHVDRRFEQLIATLPAPSLIFLESPTRRVLPVFRELRRHGVSPEETAPAAAPGLDATALCEELASFSVGLEGRSAALAALSRHLEAASHRSAESLEVNRIEVIRLNGPDPLSQKIVVALDLGDKANDALRARLPKHESLIAIRRGASLYLVPLVPSGIAEFRDAGGL